MPITPAGDAKPHDVRASEFGLLCGNGHLDPGEECEGSELGGKTCESLGFPPGGALSCSKGCQLETGGCSSPANAHLTLVYGDSGGLVVRRMELGTSHWGPELKLPLIGAVRWTQNRISPVDPGDEVAAALTETATDLRLYLLHFGARGWGIDRMIGLPVTALDRDKRVFDLAFEASSGTALLVHSNETPNPAYRTYQKATGWSDERAVFAKAPGTGNVRIVVLAANPTTPGNEIALAYSDSDTSVFGVRWQGGKLGSATTLYQGPTGEPYQSFDIAFGGKTGHFLAIGGSTCCSCPEYWLDFDSFGTSGGECIPFWGLVRLVPRALGDEIALVIDRRYAAMWDGSGWSGFAAYPVNKDAPSREVTPWRADAAWIESPTPTAVMVHRGWAADDGSGAGKIFWASSQGPSWAWTTQTPEPVPGMGQVAWPLLRSVPGGTKIMTLLSDDKRQLWAATLEGKTWMVDKTPVGTNLTTVVTRPFSMDLR